MSRNIEYVYLLYAIQKTEVSLQGQFLGVFEWEGTAIEYLESRGEVLSDKDKSELKFYKKTFSRKINFQLDMQIIDPIIETLQEKVEK